MTAEAADDGTADARVLLVHGAWHGAWCWDDVLARVPDAVAIDLPSNHGGGGFAADVAAVRATLDRMRAPVVLVGHSYGGAVITEAGTHPNTGHLVYLASLALDTGETMQKNAAAADPVASAAPAPKMSSAVRVDADAAALVVDPALAADGFYADCAQQPVDRLVPHPLDAFGTPINDPAWKHKPSTFVLCTQDETIRPEVQRFFASRCDRLVELDSSHSPMLSMPDQVAEIIASCL